MTLRSRRYTEHNSLVGRTLQLKIYSKEVTGPLVVSKKEEKFQRNSFPTSALTLACIRGRTDTSPCRAVPRRDAVQGVIEGLWENKGKS